MKTSARALGAALLVFAMAGTARADDRSDLQTKLVTALKTAKSFTTTMVITASGLVVNSTIVEPDRAKTTVAAGGMTYDSILIGSTLYRSQNGSPFEQSAAPPAVMQQMNQATAMTVVSVLPDLTDGGKTYGAYTTSFATAAGSITLNCRYDKLTYRPAACANDRFSVTYGGYDDSKNTVDVPAAAK